MRRESKTFLEFIAKANIELDHQRQIIEKQERLIKTQEKGVKPNETLLAIAFDEMNKKLNEMREIVNRQNEILVEQDKRIDSLSNQLNKALNGEKEESILESYKPL